MRTGFEKRNIVHTRDELRRFQGSFQIVDFSADFSHHISVNGQGSHHSLVFYEKYRHDGYDNVVLGMAGTSREAIYLLSEDGSTSRTITSPERIQQLDANNFIIIDGSLYHIPSGISTDITEPASALCEHSTMSHILTVEGKNKQFQFTGGTITTHEETIDAETVSEDNDRFDMYRDTNTGSAFDLDDFGEETRQLSDEQESYRQLLQEVVHRKTSVLTSLEAEMYLNDNITFSDEEKTRREFLDQRERYKCGENTLSEWNSFLDRFFDENPPYVRSTGDSSDTQVSALGEEFEPKKQSDSFFR